MYHKFLRSSLVPTLVAGPRDTQCGDLPSRSVDIAHHVVNIFCARARAMSRSCAPTFLDVLAAFDSVLRAIAFLPEHNVYDTAQLFRRFQLPPEAVAESISHLHSSALEEAGASDYQCEMLGEVYGASWLTVQGREEVSLTEAGTKPGYPLGDIIFNCVALRVLTKIESTLIDAGLTESIPLRADGSFESLGLAFPARASESVLPSGVSACEGSFVDDPALPTTALPATLLTAKVSAIAELYPGVRVFRFAVEFQCW
ncbi:hypothetical protein N9L68_05275 [bacterium]|nr:hypothetical protein [bacterium]